MIGVENDDRPVAAVVDELVSVFAGCLSRRVITAEVERAACELQGQVPEGARPELLHRLAAHRLVRPMAAGRSR